jgi:hypothetical protein
MSRQIYTVQYNGKEYDIEGDRPPTEQDMPGIVGQSQPQGQPQQGGILNAAKNIGKMSITPLLSAETIKKSPVMSGISSMAPLLSYAMGVPRQGLLTPQNIKEEGAETVSSQTSPLAIAGNIGILGGLNAPKLKGIGNITRGGVSAEEAARIAQEYGNSNAGLVDKVKKLLDSKLTEQDELFSKTIANAPKKIQIPTDQFGDALKKSISDLKSGVGKSDPVVGHLQAMLDDITGENEVSKVLDVNGNPISTKPAGYIPMDKKTFLGTRRNIGNILTGNGEIDRLIMPVKEALDDSAIEAGISGLDEAKKAYKNARDMQGRFLNKNTGDLKIANEQGLNKVGSERGQPLTKQQLDHIKELENYVGHPITKDAETINKINAGQQMLKRAKKFAIGAAGFEGLHRIVSGRF